MTDLPVDVLAVPIRRDALLEVEQVLSRGSTRQHETKLLEFVELEVREALGRAPVRLNGEALVEERDRLREQLGALDSELERTLREHEADVVRLTDERLRHAQTRRERDALVAALARAEDRISELWTELVGATSRSRAHELEEEGP